MYVTKGGCMCGRVKYEFTGQPSMSLQCQCRQCQKITGTGHSSELAIPVDQITISGGMHFYELTSDSGSVMHSKFCPNCGNPILKQSTGFPTLLFIAASTLLEPQHFQPEKVYFHSSAQPWDYVNPDLELVPNQ